MLVAIDLLEARLADPGLLDAREIAFRGAVVHVPPREGAFTASAGEAARAATCRDVLDAAPVERVVHGLETLAGEVGDLVADIPAAGKLSSYRLAHGGLLVVGRQDDLAAANGLRHRHVLGQPGERQGIGADVLRAERHGGGGIARGRLDGVARSAVDEIERDVVESRRARGAEGALRVGARVLASQDE